MSDQTEIIRKKELKCSVVSLRSDGIINFHIKPDVTLNIIDAKEIVAATAEIGEGKRYPLLITAGSFSLVDNEVRKYASSIEGNKYTIASAIVVNNVAQKLMGNAYIKFNQPPLPTRLFTTEKEAVLWLQNYIGSK
jgi:hypothetical protein